MARHKRRGDAETSQSTKSVQVTVEGETFTGSWIREGSDGTVRFRHESEYVLNCDERLAEIVLGELVRKWIAEGRRV